MGLFDLFKISIIALPALRQCVLGEDSMLITVPSYAEQVIRKFFKKICKKPNLYFKLDIFLCLAYIF